METHTVIGWHGRAEVSLTADERRRHIAVFGSTGVGKSSLLRRIVAQDIARGDGLLLIDPHGTLAEEVLRDIPPERHNHVCYLNPADIDFPVGLNVLEDVHPDARAAAVDAVVGAMRGIWRDTWGARLEIILRHAATALMETPGASFALLPRLLTDNAFRDRIVSRIESPLTRAFFDQRFNAWRDTFRNEAVDPVLNKVEAFLAFPAIRNILGQARSTLHFAHAMEKRRIVIANLGKGLLGESAAHLLGALLIARIQSAGMGRSGASSNADFHLIVDEAQNFGTDSVASLLSEARKFGISLVLATQYLAGLTDATRAATLGNVGTLISYRVGSDDANALAPEFNGLHQEFNPQALRDLARGEAIVRSPCLDTTRIEVDPLPPGEGDAMAVKQQCRRHYGVRRTQVEDRISRALGFQ
ncbi:MAG: type IV secretion system DNA-binding domain-containing protein [Minisyncoccia bacterium]